MKTTIYELLGMIKDNKAPKKILYDGMIWRFDDEDNYYWSDGIWFDDYCDITKILNDEVEILEATITLNDSLNYLQKLAEDEIPNKIEKLKEEHYSSSYEIIDKINEIIEAINERESCTK